MRRRGLLVGAVGFASALAGCSGGDDRSPTPSDVDAVTPAPVPDDDALLAPGLTAGGVVDAAELAAAHHEAMVSQPHRSRRTTTVRDDDSVIRRQTATVTATAGVGLVRRTFSVDDTDRYPATPAVEASDFWFDGEIGVIREGDDDPTHRILDEPYDSVSLATTDRGRLRTLLDGFADGQVTDETAPFEFVADDAHRPTAALPRWLGELSEPRDASLVAGIDADGRVHGYRLTFAAMVEMRSVSVEHVSTYDVDMSVEAPEWLDEWLDER